MEQLSTLTPVEMSKHIHSKSAYLGFEVVHVLEKLANDIQEAKEKDAEVRAAKKEVVFTFTVEAKVKLGKVRGDPGWKPGSYDYEEPEEGVWESLGRWGKGVLGIKDHADTEGVEEDEGKGGSLGEGEEEG
jgi:hypothetical protein